MKIRRVVTGRDSAGRSVFTSCGPAPRSHDFVHIPGMSTTRIWSTPPLPVLGEHTPDPTLAQRSLLPPPGGTGFLIISFPPAFVMQSPRFDPIAARQETLEASPGLAERFEPESPGMHTTDTIDFGVVLDGEIWLELDDGRVEHLRQHDVVVQNGTRHAWRNKTERPTLMAFVLIGAQRS